MNNRRNDNSHKHSSYNWKKLVLVVIADIALLAASLLTYAYFHHVKPDTNMPEPIIIERPTEAPTAVPAEVTPDPNAEATPEPTAAVLTWKQKFADKFSDEIILTENSYISEFTHVTITKYETTVKGWYNSTEIDYPVIYYVTDIYITDIEQLSTTFAKGIYQPKTYAWSLPQVQAANGVVGINGDNYGSRVESLVIRNGALHRDALYDGDVLVLNYDGTMDAYFQNEVNVATILTKSPYQAWSFGPVIVRDGQKVDSPQQEDYINAKNPRSAVGYYEPGHYCFVAVEGRSDESVGADINMLADIFVSLGCQIAYNMDGGATSSLVFGNGYVNELAEGGRRSTDTIVITDPYYRSGGQ